jgi:hypothetical protein
MRLLIFILAISFWQQFEAQSNQGNSVPYNSEAKAILFEDLSQSSFSNQDERIAFHLNNVMHELENNLPEDPAKAQIKLKLIEELRTYTAQGIFPRNTLRLDTRPYFIDEFGNACAVGHLMIESGNEELALRIQEEHNNDFIPEIETTGVIDWADEFGFSLEELALIQPPAYPPPNILTELGNGTNGTVNHVDKTAYGRTYVTGPFTELNESTPCASGLAYWSNNQFTCVDDKPEGIALDNESYGSGSRILAGSFILEGQPTPLIIFNYPDDTWESLTIPGRESATATNVWNQFDRVRVSLIPEGESEATEFWYRYEDDEDNEIWTHAITVIGSIHACERVSSQQLIGGDFNSYINHLTGDTVSSSNLLAISFVNGGEFEVEIFVSEYLPDDVHAIFLQSGSITYVGGGCDTIYPNTYLSRIQNNVVLPLLYEEEEYYIPNSSIIYAIEDYFDEYLILGGDLSLYGIPGSNLARYDLTDGQYFVPIARLDSTVLHIDNYFGTIHIAGHFTMNSQFIELEHVAWIGEEPSSLSELPSIPHSIAPNPATTEIRIAITETINSVESLTVYSLDGKEQSTPFSFSDKTISLNIESLSKGVKIYHISMNDGRVFGRFLKE